VADLEWLGQNLPGWVFRGQADSTWRLQPLLERISPSAGLGEMEAAALTVFRRKWEAGGRPCPSAGDHLSWLALSRHHGGSTRLLDFTTALPVALYFATQDVPAERPAIWAVNGLVLARLLSSQVTPSQRSHFTFDDPVQGWEVFNRIYPHRLSGFAAAVFSPRGDNPRMNAQRGVFLAALNMEYNLEENLYGMFDRSPRTLFETGPQGYFFNVRNPSTLRALRKAPVIKLELLLEDQDEVRSYLSAAGAVRESLFPE
jgi:hypothetical protein